MILLIGYGNALRGDDQAGLILAETIARAWQSDQVAVKQLSVHQLTPELALDIAQPEITAVVFVDAQAVTPGALSPRVQMQSLNVGAQSPSLGHHLYPASLLIYAHLLYDRCPPAWLVTVPAIDFSYGGGLSHLAQQALLSAQSLPLELLAHLQTAPVPTAG
jgi:hydrogenase maturation protease